MVPSAISNRKAFLLSKMEKSGSKQEKKIRNVNYCRSKKTCSETRFFSVDTNRLDTQTGLPKGSNSDRFSISRILPSALWVQNTESVKNRIYS